jgi:hypothetical protein
MFRYHAATHKSMLRRDKICDVCMAEIGRTAFGSKNICIIRNFRQNSPHMSKKLKTMAFIYAACAWLAGGQRGPQRTAPASAWSGRA